MADFKFEFGYVAILDALGAASYGNDEIAQFLKSRQRVLDDLNSWIEDPHGVVKIDPKKLVIFTLNDTIVIVLRCGQSPPTLRRAVSFAATLRKFIVDSMANGILFRGAASCGAFYVDSETNTVMGKAVTDAAQWYEATDWIGVHFTPRSYMELSRMIEESSAPDDKKEWAFFLYDVPLRDGTKVSTFAINWPKIFKLKARPWDDAKPIRAKLLEFLAGHQVPMGTEQKYFNTMAFFDHSVANYMD